jgi:TolB-like protein/DNA-binding winged helix-turn-helix (wHTH) protein/Tfp pilus assembly protein PilF
MTADDESPEEGSAQLSRRLRVADLIVDLERGSVWRGAEPLEITDRSFRLLAALIRHAPDLVDKDRLIEEVWDDAVVSDETLAQRVRLLRQALGDDSRDPRYIASVRGRGYRLAAEVHAADESTAPPRSPAGWLLAAVVLVAVLGLAWWLAHDPGPGAPGGESEVLAVLPFADLGAAQDHQFFADGMQEELLSQLAGVDDLAIISRTSVERFRGSTMSLPDIAAELGADAVVEGSVRVDGDRLRVTVQLIDAVSDEHLWAASFDRQLSMQDIFAVQTEVASRIAESLRLEYSDPAITAEQLPTASIEAYNLYLLGRYNTYKLTRTDLERAVGYLEQAIDIDPEFAEAWATLGWTYSFLGSEYGGRLPTQMYPKAREAALRAISLDGRLSDARTLYADILTWYDWEFDAAEREYRKAIELNPLNVLGYALFLSTQGRHDEAIATIEKRVAADPNDPFVRTNAGWRYLNAGLPDKAISSALKATDHRDSTSLLGWSRLAQDDPGAAIEVFERAIATEGRSPTNVANLAVAYFRDGRAAAAQALLDELINYAEDQQLSPVLAAKVYFSADDADKGFALLEQAYEQRRRDMIFLGVTEYLRGYRDDPRYRSLVERVGLPQE